MLLLLGLGDEELTGHMERIPAAVILRMPDPDREVVTDPAPREESVQGIGWWMLAEELTHGRRLDPRIAHRALIKRAEERDATIRIIFPAVLAVEDHRDERR